MSITPAELWQKISSYSLALPDQCRQWANDIARTRGPAAALQTEEIIAYLRDQNVFTPYQLQQLTSASNPLLKIGPWRIEDALSRAPFSRWLVGNDISRNRKRWLFVIDENLLQQPDVRQAGPSLEWSKIQGAIKQNNGWNFDPPEKHSQQLLLVAQPLEGQLALPQPKSPTTVARWVSAVAQSLQELHQTRMIHGHIRPDRLWIDSSNQALLLRDPLIPPTTAGAADGWSPLDQQLGSTGRINYLAPELSVPGQNWTPAADIYSLGCLWYWLLTGTAPFAKTPAGQVAVQHAVTQLYVSEELVGGPQLAECFRFCLAKNPATRFPSAQSLCAAIETALSVTTAPVAKPSTTTKSVANATEPTKSAPPPLPVTPSVAKEAPPLKQPATAPAALSDSKPEPAKTPETKPGTAPPNRATNAPTPRTAVPSADLKTENRPQTAPISGTSPPATVSKPTVSKPTESVPNQPPTTTNTPGKSAEQPTKQQPEKSNLAQTPPASPKSTAAPAVAPPTATIAKAPSEEPKPSAPPIPQPTQQNATKPAAASPKEIPSAKTPPPDTAAQTKSPDQPLPPKAVEPKPASKPEETSRKPAEPKPITPTITPPVAPPTPASTAPVSTGPISTAQTTLVSSAASEPPPVSAPPATSESPPVATKATAEKPKTAEAAPGTKNENVAKPAVAPLDLPSVGSEQPAAPPVASSTVSKKEPGPKKTSKKASSVATAPKKKKNTNTRPAWFLPALGGGGFILMTLLLLLLNAFSGGSKEDKPKEPTVVGNDPTGVIKPSDPVSVPKKTEPAPRDLVGEKFNVVRNDTNLPWAPPTAGDPFSLDLLPPEAQAWIYWRPSKFVQDPQGQQLLALLEADFTPAAEYLRTRSGLVMDDLKSVVVALYPGKEGKPEIAVRYELNQPKALSELKTKWGDPQERTVEKQVLLENAQSDAYFVSQQPLNPEQSVTSFTVGPKTRMEELVKLDGGTPPLRRQLEQLYRNSDMESDITILFVPGFLFTDGRQILANSVPALRDPLATMLATDMQAGMISMTLQPQWYTELRLVGNSDVDASRIAKNISEKLNALPGEIENRMIAGSFHPSWGKLSVRYAQMLREMLKQLRVNVEDGQAIANFYLPNVAAPNLIVASWYAANSQPGAAGATSTASKPTEQPILTPEELLDRPIKLAFDQESLEVALQSIAEAAADGLPSNQPKLSMELDYNSMEKEGITQNQQIRQFMHDGKPLRDVLTDLVKRANPVVGVTDTKLPDQKLLWVLIDAADKPGGKSIKITTRTNANDSKLPLPKEFAP